MVINGNEKEFDSYIKEGIVLVDFYANWCGPCKMLSPVLEEITNDRSEVNVVKIDVDQNENISKEFGVMSIPTVLLFKDGNLIDKKVGFQTKDEIMEWINK